MARSSVSQRVLRTPPRSTRGKPTISYAEPPTDSDDDLEEEENGDAAEQPHRGISYTPRTRVPRTRTRNPPASRSANNKTHVATTKSTRQKPVISYAEASTDTELEDEEDESEDNEQSHNASFHTPRSRLPRNASRSRASTKRLLSRSPESMPKRRKQNGRSLLGGL